MGPDDLGGLDTGAAYLSRARGAYTEYAHIAALAGLALLAAAALLFASLARPRPGARAALLDPKKLA